MFALTCMSIFILTRDKRHGICQAKAPMARESLPRVKLAST